jgi:hypothetical protein
MTREKHLNKIETGRDFMNRLHISLVRAIFDLKKVPER